MTDFTSNTPMVQRGRKAAEKREYSAYFALIFLTALPLALIVWALTALRQFRLPQTGPIKSAWAQAGIITPIIFSK